MLIKYEDQIDVKRAMITYLRNNNDIEARPNPNFSKVETHRGKRYVVLGNCSDTIAVYSVRPSGSLRHHAIYPKILKAPRKENRSKQRSDSPQ
jgi:hypothetical protein